MWKSPLILLALAVALPAAALAAERPAPGSLSIEEGRGIVVIKGEGGVLVKLDGVLQIVDLTPRDRWTPIINGEVTNNPRLRVRGAGISLRLLGGKFKLLLRGESIAVSARGRGVATLKGETDLLGFAGLFSTDPNADCVELPEQCSVFPAVAARVPYGLATTEQDEEEIVVKEEKTDRGRTR